MNTKVKVLISVFVLTGAFAAGRYSLPEKVRVETQIVEVEKKTKNSDVKQDKHKETVVVEVVKPDGTKETTTKIVEDNNKNTKTAEKDITDKDIKTESLTIRGDSKVTLSLLGGAPLQFNPNSPQFVIYGGSITKPVLGPLTVGVWGLSNSTFGGSIGWTF